MMRSLKNFSNMIGFGAISKVDIDNDGIDEIRLFTTVGSSQCTPSYLYKQDTTGRFHLISNQSYAVLREKGRFCRGTLCLYASYEGKVYALEVYEQAGTGWINNVWLGSGSDVKKVCTYKHSE